MFYAHLEANKCLNRALIRCHAGCAPEEIVGALGLTLSDLMPETPTTARPMPRAAPKAAAKVLGRPPKAFATAAEAVELLEKRYGPRAALWTYFDAHREPVGQVVRWNRPDGEKDIRPVSKTAAGWVIGGMPDPRPLYRLPELLATTDRIVYVVEGEKCVEALTGLELLATTSAGGAQAASKTDWKPLAGRDVALVPDDDPAGAKYAADVAAILAALTPPARVRTLCLRDIWEDLPEGGDIADVVERKDASAVKAKLEALLAAAEPDAPPAPPPVIAPFKPFPTDVLPEPVRSFVQISASAIGCDESFVALPLLSALASVIGNSRRIELKPGWTEPAIIWTAVVGDSGTMKSPALEVALRAVRRRQHTALKRHNQEMIAYQDALLQWEKDSSAWKRSKQKDDPPRKPEEPRPDRCWCDDVTVEALAQLLKGQWRGLLMVRDELAGWLGGFDRYAQGKGGDAPKWLELFGGRPMMVDRKSGPERIIYIPRAAVSVCGGIQPATLAKALGTEHRENGLAARLLLACPPRTPKRWTKTGIPEALEDVIAEIFTRLYDLHPIADTDGEPQPAVVTLALNAEAAWENFYNAHGQEQVELTGDLSAVWSKLEGYAARLALVLHCVRQAAGDPTLANPNQIDAASVAGGVALSRWFGSEAERVYEILAEGDDKRDRRRLVELVGRKGGSISARELTQSSRSCRSVAEATAALQSLVDEGCGTWQVPGQHGRGGPKARRFVLGSLYAVDVYRNAPEDVLRHNSVDVDIVDKSSKHIDR
jgi:hypothetical protein